MKKVLFVATILALTSLYLTRCANPRSPMGGPQDTIPPQLIQSFPSIGSINFNDQEITLVFDEYINADKLTQSLIISPKSDIKFKHIVKKNELLIKFDEPLKGQHNVQLQFLQRNYGHYRKVTSCKPGSCVQHWFLHRFTLRNWKNRRPFLPKNQLKKAVVGLYEITDSLDLLTDFPNLFHNYRQRRFLLTFVSQTWKIQASDIH